MKETSNKSKSNNKLNQDSIVQHESSLSFFSKTTIQSRLDAKPGVESNVVLPHDKNAIQKKCTECETAESVQARSDNESAGIVSSDIENSLTSSKGKGSPLHESTRAQMENSFGADFSNVRIHSDNTSVQMSKDLNAQAFTHGNNIYFNTGKYDTSSPGGKHLLAHELTHTLQQTGTKQNTLSQNVSNNSDASLLSRAPELTPQQKKDGKNVKTKVLKAIKLLSKAGAQISDASQKELLDQMLEVFNQVTIDQIGNLDSKRGRITIGRPVRWFVTFSAPGEMSRPYEYRIYFDVSHETEGEADAYFHAMGNYGGQIVMKVNEVKSYSVDQLAEILAHEAVHMFSHMQRTVKESIGTEEATMIPGKKAAGILDTSSFSKYRKVFTGHFTAVVNLLNKQTHRDFSLDKLSMSVIDEWNRKLIEETIAYVYQSRIALAVELSKAKRSAAIMGFAPMRFLKDYMTKHWLTDKRDQAAMDSKEGQDILKAMEPDMLALGKDVEAQVAE